MNTFVLIDFIRSVATHQLTPRQTNKQTNKQTTTGVTYKLSLALEVDVCVSRRAVRCIKANFFKVTIWLTDNS